MYVGWRVFATLTDQGIASAVAPIRSDNVTYSVLWVLHYHAVALSKDLALGHIILTLLVTPVVGGLLHGSSWLQLVARALLDGRAGLPTTKTCELRMGASR